MNPMHPSHPVGQSSLVFLRFLSLLLFTVPDLHVRLSVLSLDHPSLSAPLAVPALARKPLGVIRGRNKPD